MKRTITTILLALITVPVFAGGNITLGIADNFYSRLAFNKAAEYYEKYLKKNDDDIAVWEKLSHCYDKTNEYAKLETTLATLVELEGEISPEMYLMYGEVSQVLGKEAQAVKWYKQYLDLMPEDRRAKNQLEAVQEASKDPSGRFKIENMEFNTPLFEYGPNIFNNTLLYTSTGHEENKGNKVHQWTGDGYSDIRQYERDTTHEVFIFFNQIEHINTTYNDGVFTVDPSTEQFYYTRNNYNPNKAFNKKGLNSENHMNLKIYIAENDLGAINDIQEFQYNDEEYNTAHPTISPNGDILVFVSDKPSEEAGGRDLYFCKRSDKGWSEPQLLSTDINTEGDEIFPIFHQDGSLYLASDGLGSMGGLDIFQAEIDFESNSVLSLHRLDAPLNSTHDDFAIVFDKNQRGYFTSDRPGGKGKDDIYSFVDHKLRLKILVLDDETERAIPLADLRITNGDVTLFDGQVDARGRYSTLVTKGDVIDLFADHDSYFEDTETVNTAEHEGLLPIEVVLRLKPIEYRVLVLDANTGLPVPGARVSITTDCSERRSRKSVTMGEDGMERIPVHKDCGYILKAKSSGYLLTTKEWQSPSEDKHATVEILLDNIIYEPIVLHNIYYDFDKHFLRLNESAIDLDMLLNFMAENPELTIRINSHTDARATKAYNIDLSQRRAQSVVDFLISMRVDPKRLFAKGFGETMPLNDCTDNVRCSEEEHQQNRRTEFQVVNADGSTIISSDARKDIRTDPCTNCPF